MEAKSVVVIQDAYKEVNSRVFSWAIKGLSLKRGDKLTLVAVLYQLYTPMGYITPLDNSSMVGANQRIIEIQAARKKEEYKNNEKLGQISKLYESEEVEFKIELVTGTSLKELALKKAEDLKATWVILDRQMKKDTEYFLQKLSCGISRLKRNNRIEHLRGQPELPTEINDGYPEDDDTFSMEGFPKKQEKIQISPHMKEDSTLAISSNQTTGQTKPDQLRTGEKEPWNSIHDDRQDFRHAEKSNQMIGQINSDLLSQDQKLSISHENIRDGKQGKSIFGNSKCCICSMSKNRRSNIGWEKDFTYKELQVATDGFSEKNSLSEGGYGSIFIGQLEGELKIVVKQHLLTDSQIEKNMKSQVQLILKARHKNVTMLLGSSIEGSKLLTVYEYACNGSLDKYLSKESCRPLSWEERVRVAVGVSRGLKYLHENNIIHGSIKPSNILLNHDFEPLLGDFSFGKTKHELNKSYKDKNLGNSGYAAPEHLDSGKLSIKADVYSFGVVLLELITGQRATDKISGQKSLVGWAKPLLGGKKYPQLVDPKIRSSYEEDHLLWLVQVTEQCLRKNPKERLTMNMVVSSLQGITDSKEDIDVEDISQALSCSTCSASEITGSQGQTKSDQLTQEEQIKNTPYREESNSRLTIKNNDKIVHGKHDQLSQDEIQMQSRPAVEERISGEMINKNHMMGMTEVDRLCEVEEQVHSNPHGEEKSSRQKISNNPVIGQTKVDKPNQDQEEKSSFNRTENLLDGHQGELILQNSKSFVCSICKSRRPNIGWKKDFTFNELQAATDGFSIKNSLSEGENGPAFRGLLESKLNIVVKKHQITSSQEDKIFKSEVQLLSKAIHKNVVMLLGSCTDKSQVMIVYEYACNGSLDQYLSRKSRWPLTWRQRVKVAIGASRGLKYLHEINIIHGSIKPSNILLTHEFEPLLGDFGFGNAKLELKKSHKDKNVQNSEYTAPEYFQSGKLSSKTDVYSFGVVLLELITGRRATDKLSGGKSLVQWAKPLLGGKKYPQLVDTKISSSCKEDQLQWLIQVTEQCLRKNPKERLSMNMVVSALQDIAEIDDFSAIEDSSPEKFYLPHSMPDATSSQGQIKAGQLSWEQEQIENSPYGEERSLRPKIKTNDIIGHAKVDQLSQDGEQKQSSPRGEERRLRLTISNSHMIDQIKADQMSQDQEDFEASFQIEQRGLRLAPISNQMKGINKADEKQELSPDKKQMQSSSHEDSMDGDKGHIMLEVSKSSVCSIYKSKRPKIRCQKNFTYKELQVATDGFSIKNSLSEGAYGPAFRGQLECKLKIVVKQLQMTSSHEERIFKSEVQLLTRARHKNVVMLLGSCIEETKLLIVYENACNGSLDQYLSEESHRLLAWSERVKVALGISRGLKHLHENNIIHGSIKPSNILLTHEFEPLLGDFGFGKSKNELKNWHNKDKKVRNSGYTAPEFMESGKLSIKSDVYSFGVVLLQLITGHRVIDKISGQKSLVQWARPLLRGKKYPQLVDPKISSSCDDQELLSLVQVTEKCLRKNPRERLTMNMVISALPCVVDNKPHLIEDSSAEMPCLTRSLSDVASTQDNEESPAVDNLSGDVSQERANYITSSRSTKETKVSQETKNNITCGGSNEETQETERLSIYQESQTCISYGGARNFFLGGSEEYIVDENFFSLCNSL